MTDCFIFAYCTNTKGVTHITVNSFMCRPARCWHMVVFEHICCCTVLKTDSALVSTTWSRQDTVALRKDCQKITSATHGHPPSLVLCPVFYGKCTSLSLSVCRLRHSSTCGYMIIKLSFMSFSIFV